MAFLPYVKGRLEVTKTLWSQKSVEHLDWTLLLEGSTVSLYSTELPYFSIDNVHLMYNAHPNAHDAN